MKERILRMIFILVCSVFFSVLIKCAELLFPAWFFTAIVVVIFILFLWYMSCPQERKQEDTKKELLKEFRDHFCDAYCQYYGDDGFCKDCPIKDEKRWLKDKK